MATPVQYTPQYVPMDIGTMSNILDRKQVQYNTAYAAPLMFEDQFSQIQVTPENIPGKNAVIRNFKDRINTIVERYNGDYGAAAKDISREIAKERNNPFYQLAPQHTKAVAKQQELMDKYGAFALPLQNVTSQFISPEGKVVSNPNLDPVVLNQQDLEKALYTEFGPIRDKVRESGLSRSNKFPQFFVQNKTRGATTDEVPVYKDQMIQRLYDMNPHLAKAIENGDPRAIQIAENVANSLVGGNEKQYMEDDLFMLNYKNGLENQPDQGKNYILAPGAGEETGYSIEESQGYLDQYKINAQIEKQSSGPKTPEIANYLKEHNLDPSKPENWTETDIKALEAIQPSKSSERQKSIEGLEAKHKREAALKKFQGPMLDDLMKNYGFSEEQAVEVVAREKAKKPMTHYDYIRPSADISKEGMINDLRINLKKVDLPYIDVIEKDGEVSRKTRERREESIKSEIYEGNVTDVELSLKDNSIILHTKDGKIYSVPSTALGNKGITKAINNYKKINSVLNGEQTGVTEPLLFGNNIVAAEKKFDLNSGEYISKLYRLDPEKGTKEEIPNVDMFNDYFFTTIFSTYGTPGEYKKNYLN